MAYKKQAKNREINRKMCNKKHEKKEKVPIPTKPIGTGHNWKRKQARFEHKVRVKKEKERKELEDQQKKMEERRLKAIAKSKATNPESVSNVQDGKVISKHTTLKDI